MYYTFGMTNLVTLIEVWDEAHRELMIALDGVPNSDVWVRPHERLLSIGEQVGHVYYWEVNRCFGHESPHESLLHDDRFRYYSSSIGDPVTLDLTIETLRSDLEELHKAAKTQVETLNPSAQDLVPWLPGDWWNWYGNIQYMGFHTAYHTGQIYSVRHMFGHETEDN